MSCDKGFLQSLKENYGNYSRLYKTFRTNHSFYVYDVGTGKVLNCNHATFDILKTLECTNNYAKAISSISDSGGYSISEINEAIRIIEDTIQAENLFQAPPVDLTNINGSNVVKEVNSNLSQITLELTEACNLSCSYCIYQSQNHDFRDFGNNNMSLDVAVQALKYALEHTGDSLAITFYGGEPILRFNVIRQCVDYVIQNKHRRIDISFSMTTNCTLISRNMAEYFASIPNFAIVCSIDGPRHIHDYNRKYRNGKGSFNDAMIGLKNLVSAFGSKKAADWISLSMVVSAPIDEPKLEQMNHFIAGLDWLPQEVTKSISYVRESSDKEIDAFSESTNFTIYNPISDWMLAKLMSENSFDVSDLFTDDFFINQFIRIHNRILTEKPFPKYFLNGCCVPGARKVYISTNGDMYVCERMGSTPSLGNVFDGIDIANLTMHYIDNYVKSMESCKECWAVRLCSICYAECYERTQLSIDKKNLACQHCKLALIEQLSAYHSILEIKPELFTVLNQIVSK